jgi:xanthine dehydrogenase accessory factor
VRLNRRRNEVQRMKKSRFSARDSTALVLGSDVVGSAVAHALRLRDWDVVLIDDIDPPGPWRGMSFVNAWYLGTAELDGVAACFCASVKSIPSILYRQALIAATSWSWPGVAAALMPEVEIDTRAGGHGMPANLRARAPAGLLTVGCGAEFVAGEHVDLAIDAAQALHDSAASRSGRNIAPPAHSLARAATNTRLLVAPRNGRMRSQLRIGEHVEAGEPVGDVNGAPLVAQQAGVLRGLSARGARVSSGQVVAEIDPLDDPALCYGVDAGAARLAGAVLRALKNAGLITHCPERLACPSPALY